MVSTFDPDDLRNQLLIQVDKSMGEPPDDKMQRFWNIFYDAVAPLLKTPRDVVRLSNTIKVSWNAVAVDADRADFLAIEAMRMFLPTVYEAVRAHPDLLTGSADRGANPQALEAAYNETFLAGLSPRNTEIAKRALRRLFPRLDGVWSRVSRSFSSQWQRERLACSPQHFPTYFSFGVTGDLITTTEIESLIAGAGTPGATAKAMKRFLATKRRKGGTRAALALEELSVHSGNIAEADVGQFLIDLFRIADELHVKLDEQRGYQIASNELRIHWLLNNLLPDRFELPVRTKLLKEAALGASIGWLVSLADRFQRKKDGDGFKEDSPSNMLIDSDGAAWLFELSTTRIRAASSDNTLTCHPSIINLLFRWRDRVGDLEVRAWTESKLADENFIYGIARDAIRETWSHGIESFGSMGDRVAQKSEYVHLEPMSPFLNVVRFRQRVQHILVSENLDLGVREVLERFQATRERDPAA